MEYAQLLDDSTVWIIDNAANVAIAIAVLIAGIVLSGFVAQRLTVLLARTKAIDGTVAPLLAQIARDADRLSGTHGVQAYCLECPMETNAQTQAQARGMMRQIGQVLAQ